PAPAPVASRSKSSKAAASSQHKAPVSKAKVPPEPVIPPATAPRVRSLQMGEKAWLAATDDGLFISVDQGQKWYGQAVEGERNFSTVNCYPDGTVALASPKSAYLSRDEGKTWIPVVLPQYVSGVYNLTMTPGSVLWLGTREGAARSTDGGQSWHYMQGGLPKNDVLAVRYDASGQRLLATALHSHEVFASKDDGQTWQRTPEAVVSIRSAISFQGRLLAASAHNGLLLESNAVTPESARAAEAKPAASQ
ncbi:MAG TPA: hypothetical protein VJX73_07810, partial [Terracidiphilus sp.]|nr:hypothetical protein [Terracidiphilus sp.]